MKRILSIISLGLFSGGIWCFQPVDLNIASEEQIALLPGVGKKLAYSIVKFREKNKQITNSAHLLQIRGMTTKKLSEIKDRIIFSLLVKKNAEQAIKSQAELKILPKKPILALSVLERKVLDAHGLSKRFDDSLRERARISAYLPKLSAVLDVDRADALSKKIASNGDSSLKRGAHNIGFGIRLTFDLDKLIFNKDELDIARLLLKRIKEREVIIAKLHKNYFRYLFLMEKAQIPQEDSSLRIIASEMREITALLDSMSLGEFSAFHREDSFE
jgi:competence ComEA-like helix-hairpin-helix protein